MEFINQYFMQIIISIIILTIIIIIAIVKKPTNTKTDENKKPKEEKANKEEITKTVVQKAEIQEKPKLVKRTKRELVPHAKITKDDFSIFKGTRVLIAEDNFINQKVITGLLADSGIDITMANDGQECMNILKEDTNFALILMDAHMPVMDGFQATREIRKNPKFEHIPVIALSGDTAADDIKNMLNVGMEAHLEKPLKIDSFYDILYIYTTGDEADKSQSSLNKTKDSEFDINQGLEICGSDKEFYLEILNEFINNYADSDKKIAKYLNEKNIKDADKLLLDITGLAANIGADYLHEATLDLKLAIASPDDMTYINSLRNFKRTLVHITQLIQKYIQDNKF